jgi:hypothetical protein
MVFLKLLYCEKEMEELEVTSANMTEEIASALFTRTYIEMKPCDVNCTLSSVTSGTPSRLQSIFCCRPKSADEYTTSSRFWFLMPKNGCTLFSSSNDYGRWCTCISRRATRQFFWQDILSHKIRFCVPFIDASARIAHILVIPSY